MNSVIADEGAVARLLQLADARDFDDGEIVAEVAPQDAIVARSEPAVERLARQFHAELRQRVVPRDPVVFRGVDQRAVHVPQDSARHRNIGLADVGPSFSLGIDASPELKLGPTYI